MVLSKRSIQNLVLACVSIVVALAMAEGVVRFAIPQPVMPGAAGGADPLGRLMEFDPVLQTRYRPGVSGTVRSQYGEFEVTYQTNELGLRDRPLAANGGVPRVLVLGNSFVEGWGVEAEASFIRLAEARFNAGRAPVRLVNAGMSGYGAAQSYLLGRELMAKTEPAALMFVYASTMVQADYKYLKLADVDAQRLATGLNPDNLLQPSTRASEKPGSAWRGAVSAGARYSALLRLVDSTLAAADARAAIKPGDPESDLLAGTRAPADRLAAVHEPSLRHAAALAALAEARGLPFLLVHLPMPHQLSAEAWALGRAAYGLENKVYPAEDVAVVAEFCRQRGFPCVSAHAALRAALNAQPAGSPLYYRYDFHLNAEGNRVVGEWLAGQLGRLFVAATSTSRER